MPTQTTRERIISLCGFTPSKESVDGELIDFAIDGNAIYNGSNKSEVKQIAVNLIELLFSTPDQTNDVGMTIKYDRGAVEKRLAILKGETGETLVKRNISRAAPW